MNKRHLTGILGGIIPIFFLIGFYLFIFEYNPDRFKLSDGEFVVGLVLKGMPGYELAKFFNYIFIGFTIICFSISLIKNTSNKGLNRIGKILILLSGAIYFSFGLTDIADNSDSTAILFLGRILLTLILGAIGFIFISDEFLQISNNKVFKWLIFSLGILILLNGSLQVLAMDVYPSYMGLVNWLIYFGGLGVIGISLLIPERTIKPSHNNE